MTNTDNMTRNVSIVSAVTVALAMLSTAVLTTESQARKNTSGFYSAYDCNCKCKVGGRQQTQYLGEHKNVSTCSRLHFGKSCSIGGKKGKFLGCYSNLRKKVRPVYILKNGDPTTTTWTPQRTK